MNNPQQSRRLTTRQQWVLHKEPSKKREAERSIDNVGGSKMDQRNCNSMFCGIEAIRSWLTTSLSTILEVITSKSNQSVCMNQTHPPHCKGMSNYWKNPMRVLKVSQVIMSVAPINRALTTPALAVCHLPKCVETHASPLLGPNSPYPQQETRFGS